MKFIKILDSALLFLKKYNGYIWSTVFVLWNLVYHLYVIPRFHINKSDAFGTTSLTGMLVFCYYKIFQTWIPFGINKLK